MDKKELPVVDWRLIFTVYLVPGTYYCCTWYLRRLYVPQSIVGRSRRYDTRLYFASDGFAVDCTDICMNTASEAAAEQCTWWTRAACRTGRHKTLCKMRALLVKAGLSAARMFFMEKRRQNKRRSSVTAPADLAPRKGLGIGGQG